MKNTNTCPPQVAELARERDEIEVHRQQHQLDAHQQQDDVLAVEEDAGDAERRTGMRRASMQHEVRAESWLLSSPAFPASS